MTGIRALTYVAAVEVSMNPVSPFEQLETLPFLVSFLRETTLSYAKN